MNTEEIRRQGVAERKEQGAKATSERLDHAQRVAADMHNLKKLSIADRKILVRNLGGIAESIFGGEATAKRAMVDIFKTAFEENWESQYKKRGRFFRFSSEKAPMDVPGATYARGWAFLNLARALSRLDPRAGEHDPRAESRMILRMIEGTSFANPANAKRRHVGKSEAAFRELLRGLTRRLEPKLGRMLTAGLEAGLSIDDFSSDLNGMEAEEFLLRGMPSVKIGKIVQKLPVVHAVPLGITVETLSRRFVELASDPAELRHLLSAAEQKIMNDDKRKFAARGQDPSILDTFFLAVFGSSGIMLDVAASAFGKSQDKSANTVNADWIIETIGRQRLELMFYFSVCRDVVDRFLLDSHPDLIDLPVGMLLDAMLSNNAMIDLQSFLLSAADNGENRKDESRQASDYKDLDESFVEQIRLKIEQCFVRSEYVYSKLYDTSQYFMYAERSLTVSPALDKATNDWCLMLAVSCDHGGGEINVCELAECINQLKDFVPDLDVHSHLFTSMFMNRGEFARADFGVGDRIAIGKTWDNQGHVYVTFYPLFEDGDLLSPPSLFDESWTIVMSSDDGFEFCLSEMPQPASPMQGSLKLELTKGARDPLFSKGSLAAAISEDLFDGRNGKSTILTQLEEAIEARTKSFEKDAEEERHRYFQGVQYLLAPDL